MYAHVHALEKHMCWSINNNELTLHSANGNYLTIGFLLRILLSENMSNI